MRRALLVVAALVLGACARPGVDAPEAAGPLLPGLDAKLPSLQAIEVRTSGDRVAATLARDGDGWVVVERTRWPADPALVRALLDDLADATRVEAKTAMPDRHARIGVEAIAGAEAAGVELRLRGKGWNEAIVVGAKPAAGQGRFVRRGADAQAWLVDVSLDVPREPADWLDTKLIDVPLARVHGVHSQDAQGHEFFLTHRDDRFRLADVPSAAMGDSYRGDELASQLTDLRLLDVAADDGRDAERRLHFTLAGHDIIKVETWRVDGNIWARLRKCRLAPPHSTAEACEETGPWAGRRFHLPPQVAAKLLMTRDRILVAEEPQAPPQPQITQEAVNEALQRALRGEATAPPAEAGDGSR